MREYFSERKTVLIIGLVIMLATTVPYLIGFGVQGDEWRFTGFVIGVEDGNSYIAKMLTGAAGSWLFRSPYSAEHQSGVVAFLPYLLLGKLTAPPAQHEQLVVIYHIFRFAAGLLTVLASYDFLSLYTKKENLRLWGTILVNMGGGLGWVLVASQHKGLLGSLPLDFISPESFGFLGLLGFPHLAAARALFLWGLRSYLRDEHGWRTGFYWLGMSAFQPMYVPIAWCVISLHALVLILVRKIESGQSPSIGRANSQIAKASLQAVLVSSPLVVYTAISFLTDPYLGSWSERNVLPSPHWIHYLIAYGLVLPFAVAGIKKNIAKQPKAYLLLAVWIGAFPFLVYAPVTTQRRLAEGFWVALVAGMIGYFSAQKKLPLYVKMITGLILPTSLFLVVGGIFRASSPAGPAFVTRPEVQVFQYIANNVPAGSVVLSEYQTGNRLPAWAPVKVVLGHGPESVNQQWWQDMLDSSFREAREADPCQVIFEATGVEYLFWGPEEQERWRFDPSQTSCLEQMYNSEGYQVFVFAQPD